MPVTIKIDPILPKHVPADKADRLLKEYEKYMKGDLSRMLLEDFNKTVEEWHTYPSFKSDFTTPYNGARMQIYVHPVGRYSLKWGRVAGGTGPRNITSSTQMRFQVDYNAATDPAGIRPNRPRQKYGAWRRTHIVHNHRAEPRKFSSHIKIRRQSQIKAEFFNIRDRVLRWGI